jgi:UDP-4-amino-4,6-dideoxy-N-acetyl-beta-L-altrosamine N-acetyltransferase
LAENSPPSEPGGRLRALAEADLPLVLSWRNHPDIRRCMFNPQPIESNEHLAWFARASADPDTYLYVYEAQGQPSGFAKIVRIDRGQVADWGFYAAPGAAKGTGSRLGRAVLEQAFGTLGLHKLCAQVLASNERSLEFHRRMGFQPEGVLREQHFDGEAWQDVHLFGLVASEWRRQEAAR